MHIAQETEIKSLSDLVDAFQASGRYVLRREQVQSALGVSEEALKKAARRLAAKGRIAIPRRGFFVIVPIEYRSAGAPPPSWFIDELMRFHNHPYYVGLLSAAALHGAGHHQPQEFQVVTNVQLRTATAGRTRIRFFTKRHLERTPTTDMKTETGSMRVSTPEATALDLIRYLKAAGHLGNVATVLSELAERLEPERLVDAAKDVEISDVQRLGFLLDSVGAGKSTNALAAWLAEQHPRLVALRPDRRARLAPKDARWRILVNDAIEADQ
jgi:predicted transcriptional regulator of viral defense system